jgi:hypothetical protein
VVVVVVRHRCGEVVVMVCHRYGEVVVRHRRAPEEMLQISIAGRVVCKLIWKSGTYIRVDVPWHWDFIYGAFTSTACRGLIPIE